MIWIVSAAVFILALSVALAAARVMLGPSAVDRALALDLLTGIGIALVAAFAAKQNDAALIDAVIVLAALGALGSIAVGLFLGRAVRRGEEPWS